LLGRTKRIHFVGIGGIGMSGIAELLANLGYAVSGSDARRSPTTARLEQLGVTVFEGHAAAHVGDADVVVFSSAVKPANPELVEAQRRGIPVIARAEMLAELMRLRFAIAVAGSHGKTTTTSMIALVMERAGLDPTAVIGGRLSAFGSNARLGGGHYMVAEADESDRSFLMLWPSIAVMTNIDHEHMENYRDFAELQAAFAEFANRVPFYGSVVACADDAGLAAVLPRVKRPLVTYGLDGPPEGGPHISTGAPIGGGGPRSSAHLMGTDVELGAFGGRCVVDRQTAGAVTRLGTLELCVPGRHNLQNALAAVAVGEQVGLDFGRVAAALAGFLGAERRFERHGEAGGVLVVDDYGHHPTEIAAVIAAAQATLDRRLVVVFQPHRYSRTRDLMTAFGPALAGADEVVLTEIYAAGEEPVPGVTGETLAAAIREGSGRTVRLVKTLDEALSVVLSIARPGDAVITLGAGSIGTLPEKILAGLARRSLAAGGKGTAG
jgi:UDP-N-acetylmuramate--alanine ligase